MALIPSNGQNLVLSKEESQGVADNLKRIDALLKVDLLKYSYSVFFCYEIQRSELIATNGDQLYSEI